MNGILKEAINSFEGGIIIITHDEQFCHSICKEIWVIEDTVLNIKGDPEWMQNALKTKIEMKAEEEMIDANGNVVPDACNALTFSISSGPGAIYGIGNGDPADHTPDKVGLPDLNYGGKWIRNAWMGYARAVVQTQLNNPGQITLSVSSPGLTTGTASFTSQ